MIFFYVAIDYVLSNFAASMLRTNALNLSHAHLLRVAWEIFTIRDGVTIRYSNTVRSIQAADHVCTIDRTSSTDSRKQPPLSVSAFTMNLEIGLRASRILLKLSFIIYQVLRKMIAKEYKYSKVTDFKTSEARRAGGISSRR